MYGYMVKHNVLLRRPPLGANSGSQKSRKNEGEKEEKELKKVDDRPAPVAESNNSENNSDELPDVRL